jgi:hypothetical protein
MAAQPGTDWAIVGIGRDDRMAKKIQSKSGRQTFGARLSHAFFRWESAVTIALTIILVFLFPEPFSWWQWWYWLALGVAAEALIVLSSLSDIRTSKKVAGEAFRQEFDVRALRDKKLREQMEKALEYRQRIEALVQRSEEGVLQEHLRDTTAGVTDWIASIFNIARRLDVYRSDGGIQKRARREDLQRLQDTMGKAELQLENALAALGAIYAQLQLIGARDVNSGRTQRLQEDIARQIASLQDIAEAMDEVSMDEVYISR